MKIKSPQEPGKETDELKIRDKIKTTQNQLEYLEESWKFEETSYHSDSN